MTPFIVLAYFILCLMVGLLGRKTKLGLFRSLLFSIMLTPFLIMLYLLIFTTLEAEGGKE